MKLEKIELNRTPTGVEQEHEIVEAIFNAVYQQRISPGTKLGESALGDIFKVSRERVRKALFLLSNKGIVDLQSNKGAFISSPSEKDSREVFQAREIIEAGIIRQLATSNSKSKLEILRNHLKEEDKARRNWDRPELVRLSGEFHILLAESTNNSLLVNTLRELVTRTSLIVALLGDNISTWCPDHEHELILSAIESGDQDLAEKLLINHLIKIRRGLALTPKISRSSLPLRDIFMN
ncbi:MAG: GntR family transcriptional regulator [Rhodobacteraceae bacterium]|nr:GntR family transcriptional regulator [Paracoccaceae bacterium]